MDQPTISSPPRPTLNVRALASKVPEITFFFWIIKILCTTVGETAADYLNMGLNFGLGVTTTIASILLIIALVVQFMTKRYIPAAYWIVVVLISVVGTLITDNLTDSIGVPLIASTILFAVALTASFGLWYKSERTLSIHSIRTPRREAYYWLVILFTFALGTASGDLIAEQFQLGYLLSLVLFAAVIGVIAVLRKWTKISAVLLFWAAYIMTRPLGASIGDFLSQPSDAGGLNLGTTVTSYVFLGLILALIAYFTVIKKDAERTNE